MRHLLEGYRRFQSEIFPARRDQFRHLAEGQSPECLFITCSDSRVVPDLLLGTGPGDLFVVRNAGNVVPAGDHEVDGCTAAIEYAIEVLRVPCAIICGHSGCGAVKAAVERKELDRLPKTSRWLRHLEAAFAQRQPPNPADGPGAELAALIRGNVVAQLASLRAQPSVARALAEGRLQVFGWYYDILTGRIEQYDEARHCFEPLPELPVE